MDVDTAETTANLSKGGGIGSSGSGKNGVRGAAAELS